MRHLIELGYHITEENGTSDANGSKNDPDLTGFCILALRGLFCVFLFGLKMPKQNIHQLPTPRKMPARLTIRPSVRPTDLQACAEENRKEYYTLPKTSSPISFAAQNGNIGGPCSAIPRLEPTGINQKNTTRRHRRYVPSPVRLPKLSLVIQTSFAD